MSGCISSHTLGSLNQVRTYMSRTESHQEILDPPKSEKKFILVKQLFSFPLRQAPPNQIFQCKECQLKSVCTFCRTKKHNVHRLTLNLHSLKIMIVAGFCYIMEKVTADFLHQPDLTYPPCWVFKAQ